MGLALQKKNGMAGVNPEVVREMVGEEETGGLPTSPRLRRPGKSALHFGGMLRHRVRYFTDGAVIGSKAFVNEAFTASRERFAARRKDGARRLRGNGKPAAGVLWSVRDLRVDIT